MDVAPGLVTVVALIGLNAYFVAAEFAYVAVRRTRLSELREAGDRKAARALAVTKRLSFMLSGAQLGITASSLVLGWLAEPTIGRLIEPLLVTVGVPPAASLGVALTLALVLATGTQMVLGELAPKNLAIARAEGTGRLLAGPTLLYLKVAGPLIRLFDEASNRLLRLVGIEPLEALRAGADPDELEHIIAESSRTGTLSTTQTTLLARALDFRVLRAADAMVPRNRVMSLPVDATCGDLRWLARSSGHSRFLVVGDGLDDVRGVVQAKDVLGLPVAQRDGTTVSALMSEPLAVPESAPLRSLLADLRAARTPLAVVVDEFGGTAGIVTLEDVVEELVGEIRDEYDTAEPRVLRRPDGSYLVPGEWRLDEAARDTGIDLPEGEYDTLSGLVMAHLGRLPAVGDIVEVPGARLRVVSLRGHAVALAHVTSAGHDEEPRS
jgi:CBS domain containing-hemolysin-like protein